MSKRSQPKGSHEEKPWLIWPSSRQDMNDVVHMNKRRTYLTSSRPKRSHKDERRLSKSHPKMHIKMLQMLRSCQKRQISTKHKSVNEGFFRSPVVWWKFETKVHIKTEHSDPRSNNTKSRKVIPGQNTSLIPKVYMSTKRDGGHSEQKKTTKCSHHNKILYSSQWETVAVVW